MLGGITSGLTSVLRVDNAAHQLASDALFQVSTFVSLGVLLGLLIASITETSGSATSSQASGTVEGSATDLTASAGVVHQAAGLGVTLALAVAVHVVPNPGALDTQRATGRFSGISTSTVGGLCAARQAGGEILRGADASIHLPAGQTVAKRRLLRNRIGSARSGSAHAASSTAGLRAGEASHHLAPSRLAKGIVTGPFRHSGFTILIGHIHEDLFVGDDLVDSELHLDQRVCLGVIIHLFKCFGRSGQMLSHVRMASFWPRLVMSIERLDISL